MLGIIGYVVALMMIMVTISPFVYGEEIFDHQEIEIQRLLKRFNKPALKSIMMEPNFVPKSDSKYTKKKSKAVAQLWHKSGRCPKNTVPVRRTKKEDILRAKSIESFGKKTHRSLPQYISPSIGHEYAIMNSRQGRYFGTKFVINVWNPYVQTSGEFSLAQTWLVSGSGPDLNSIEAGWQVSQQIYGDTRTRLFIFWTSDGYQGKLCYNNDCQDHGFVQTNNVYTLGGAINPVSQFDGQQTELSMLIWKDGKNWWLKIGEVNVGYWPGELFTSLGNGATRVQWGGEIVNKKADGKHTSTDMGSGYFPEEGFKKASYFRNLMVVDETNSLSEPQGLLPSARNSGCYNIKAGAGGSSWRSYFFYGGSGFNANCP